MRNEVKQMICNYWDLHGSFYGIEKTPLLEELQKMGTNCWNAPMDNDKGFKELANNFKHKFSCKGLLVDASPALLQSVLLLANYVISSPKCVVKYKGKEYHTALIARGIEGKGIKLSVVAECAVKQVNIIAMDDVSMFGNILYTPYDADEVYAKAIKLITAIFIEVGGRLSDKRIFMFQLVDRSNFYFHLVQFTHAVGITVADMCAVYNHTMPDMIMGYVYFGEVFIEVDNNIMIFNKGGSVIVTKEEFALKSLHHVQVNKALQQIGAF